MYKHLSYVAAIALATLAVSCIDERYSITGDNVDGTVSIGGDSLAAPIGNSEKLTIRELLSLDGSEYLKTDADGNFYIESVSQPFSETFEITPITFTTSGPAKLEVEFENQYSGSTQIPSDIEFSNELGGTDNMVFPEIDIPGMVTELYSAGFQAKGRVSIRLESNSINKMFINNINVAMPEWLELEGESTDGNNVIISDLEIYKNGTSVTEFNITGADFTRLSGEYGFDSETGVLTVGGDVTYTGTVTGNTNDIVEGEVEGFRIVVETTISGVSSDEIELDNIDATVNYNIEGIRQTLGFDMSKEFGDSGTVLDLESAMLLLDIANNTPATGIISGNISTKSNTGEQLADVDFSLPESDAFTDMKIAVSEKGENFAEYKGHSVKGFDEILYKIPDSVIFNASFAGEDMRDVFELGTTYDMNFGYRLMAPLSFGEDLYFEYTTEINISENSDSSIDGIGGIAIRATVETTMPLGITLSARALDNDGNIIPDASIQFNNGEEIFAITPSAEEANEVPFELSVMFNDTKPSKIEILAAIAGSNGNNLNENQYIQFKDIVLIIPGGFTTDLF